jgi:hypothetical protein
MVLRTATKDEMLVCLFYFNTIYTKVAEPTWLEEANLYRSYVS